MVGGPFDNHLGFIKSDNRRKRYANPISKEFFEKKHLVFLPEWLVEGKTILDLGSCLGATGQWCLYYGAKHYTGVEVQENYALKSRKLLKHHGKKVRIVNSSFESFLKKNDRHFDIILLSGILYVLIDPYQFLQQVSKICNLIAIDNTYPKLIVDRKLSNESSIIEIVENQRINLSKGQKSLKGVGTQVSPQALKIMMKTLGFFSNGLIDMPGLIQGKDNYNEINDMMGRYLIRFEKSDRVIPDLSTKLSKKGELSKFSRNNLASSLLGMIRKTDEVTWGKKHKGQKNKVNSWKFDKKVAKNFTDIAIKNIPDYLHVIEESIGIITKCFSKSAKIIDVGSAVGNTLRKLDEHGFVNIIGVENSEHMLRESYKSKNVRLIKSNSFPKQKFDVVIANWTLHFIKNRANYLKDIFKNLNKKGLLILTEKTLMSDFMNEEYRNFKIEQGMTREEIYTKTEALKGVLISYPVEWYLKKLHDIGFKDISIVNTKHSFVTFVGRKW